MCIVTKGVIRSENKIKRTIKVKIAIVLLMLMSIVDTHIAFSQEVKKVEEV